MRIVIVSTLQPPEHGGGIATYGRNLAESLAALGHQVRILCYTKGEPRVEQINGVEIHRFSHRQLPLLESRPDLLRVIPATERTGKAMGMRKMVAQAQGEICIFTDANVLLEPESVGRLLGYFHDPAIGGIGDEVQGIGACQLGQ